MAASPTVSQLQQARNLLTTRHGTLTLYGYGIRIFVDRGHLIVKEGIGPDRHQGRFARVGHGLRRLVVVGLDGSVSLAACPSLIKLIKNASFSACWSEMARFLSRQAWLHPPGRAIAKSTSPRARNRHRRNDRPRTDPPEVTGPGTSGPRETQKPRCCGNHCADVQRPRRSRDD